MSKPLLSILVPGVPRRFDMGRKLVDVLQTQIIQLGLDKQVEVIWLVDNYIRSIGAKRQALVEASQGEYIIFCDDDDKVPQYYIRELWAAINQGKPDVVTFVSDVDWNGMKGFIEFRLEAPARDEGFHGPAKVTIRRPWHICAWKREIAIQCKFPDISWGEDSVWVDQAWPKAKTSVHIDKVMHIYSHYDHTSESTRRVQQDGK